MPFSTSKNASAANADRCKLDGARSGCRPLLAGGVKVTRPPHSFSPAFTFC